MADEKPPQAKAPPAKEGGTGKTTPVVGHKVARRSTPRKEKAVAGGKVNVYSLDGEVVRQVALPAMFDGVVRGDLIRRAVGAQQTHRRQPYGAAPRAGMRHSVVWWGKGRGVARTPRIKGMSRGAQSPNTVGGRRAWPPKVERVWSEKINRKERRLARAAAIAALRDATLVRARGHRFDDGVTLPVVVEDTIEMVDSTGDVLATFDNLGLGPDCERASAGVRVRPGRGKMRGRKYRSPKSILLVVADLRGIERGARNLVGVDVVRCANLSVEDLAPGGAPGRLAVFSEGALKAVESLGVR